MTNKSDPEFRAVIYIYYNAPPGALDESRVELQRRICQTTAAKRGLTVVKEYVDVGGGSANGRRPALTAMLHDLASHTTAPAVIVTDEARLSRNIRYYDTIERHLKRCAAELVVCGQSDERPLARQRISSPIPGFDPADFLRVTTRPRTRKERRTP